MASDNGACDYPITSERREENENRRESIICWKHYPLLYAHSHNWEVSDRGIPQIASRLCSYIVITDVGGIILLDSGLTYKTTNPASVYWDMTPNLIRYLIWIDRRILAYQFGKEMRIIIDAAVSNIWITNPPNHLEFI